MGRCGHWDLVSAGGRLLAGLLLALLVGCTGFVDLPSRAGEHERTLAFQGRTRHFYVHVPALAAHGPRPVVLSLHGGGGDAAGQALTDGLDRLSDSQGFLVVRPEGISSVWLLDRFHVWNAGTCCGKAVDQGVDDVGFLAQVLDVVERDFAADPARVYATGLSNGAMMAVRLACELSERIAAVAPVAGGLMLERCPATRPVSMLYIHGTADRCLPYDGPAVGGCFSAALKEVTGISLKTTEGIPAASVPQFLARWRELQGLSPSGVVTYQKGAATCRRDGPGPAGNELVACTIVGGGHTWPGGGYGGPCAQPESRICLALKHVSGALSTDLDASEAMWEFFRRHALR